MELTYRKPDYPAMAPVNQVWVCRGVPFDSGNRHTILYSSPEEQYSHIQSFYKVTQAALSPISLQQPIRYPAAADTLYDCNYLIIRNASFTTKTLYAFITEIQYLNPGSCLIYFTLDYIQTFLFDLHIQECFVEREHVKSDAPGEHIIDEGIQVTEYVSAEQMRAHVNDNLGVRIQVTSGDITHGQLYDHVYCGIRNQVFSMPDQIGVMQDFLSYYKDTPDNVISMQMIPLMFLNAASEGAGFNLNAQSKTITLSIDKPYGKPLDGYTPKNNKLYTYPYCFLYADNSADQSFTYLYENWRGNDCTMQLRCASLTGNPVVTCAPAGGYEGWTPTDISQYLTLENYPLCAWSSDTYKVWYAQTAIQTQQKVLNSMFQGIQNGISAMTSGNPGIMESLQGKAFNMAIGAEKTVTDLFFSAQSAKLLPDKVHGQEGSNTMLSYLQSDFYFCRRNIKKEQAQVIDDYFTMYGYRVDRVKIPELNSRVSFNYVKTRGAIVTGNLPWNARDLIAGVLDRGITFWHGDYIGDYSRDNSIAGGETT